MLTLIWAQWAGIRQSHPPRMRAQFYKVGVTISTGLRPGLFSSVPQQFVDGGLGPCAFIDAFHNHRAIQIDTVL